MLKSQLEQKLSLESVIKARSDAHAKRQPRPCGLTVHPGIGCSLGCIYCYVGDMGFDMAQVKPYALTGDELVYALLSNEEFLPSLTGTYLAFGSITEPLHPRLFNKTLQYLMAVDKWLKNPSQLSTKMLVTEESARKLSRLKHIPLSVLVTIITFKKRELEPRAPPPEARIGSIKTLAKHGFKPMLFFRPIIPGVNEEEAPEIFRAAKQSGAVAVVIGGLRVTKNILFRLKSTGIDVKEIKKRLTRPLDNDQVSLLISDVKDRLKDSASELGIIPLPSACCANTLNIYLSKGLRIPCYGLCFANNMCFNCPVKCSEIKVEVSEDELKKEVSKTLSIYVKDVEINGRKAVMYTGTKLSKSKLKTIRKKLRFLERAYRIKMVIRF